MFLQNKFGLGCTHVRTCVHADLAHVRTNTFEHTIIQNSKVVRCRTRNFTSRLLTDITCVEVPNSMLMWGKKGVLLICENSIVQEIKVHIRVSLNACSISV
jgi:hypothetical protein